MIKQQKLHATELPRTSTYIRVGGNVLTLSSTQSVSEDEGWAYIAACIFLSEFILGDFLIREVVCTVDVVHELTKCQISLKYRRI